MKRLICFLIVLALTGMVYAQRSSSPTRSSHPTSVSSSRSGSRPSVQSSSRSSSRSSVQSSPRSRGTVASRSSRTSDNSGVRPNTSSRPRVQNPSNSVRGSVRESGRGLDRRSVRESGRGLDRHPAGPHADRPAPHPHHHPHHPTPYHHVHPYPPMHHPIHHRHIHMHYWCRPTYIEEVIVWNYFWVYTHTYSTVVDYRTIQDHYGDEIIALEADEQYVYVIARDQYNKDTYFAVFDQTDRMLFKQRINRRYESIYVDEKGVWIFKRNGKDPIYFMCTGGIWYAYEED